MATVLPFSAIRPAGERAEEIAALPYDVYNREEAKAEASDKPLSFLRIDRAEINFDDSVDTYADCVYDKASEIFHAMLDNGDFVRDEGPYYYLYELTMNGRSQTGIVGLASIDDYENGIVKRHELTRRDKEEDRVRHVDRMNAQTGPIFLTYRPNDVIKSITDKVKENEDLFDFTSPDGVRHRGFIIYDKEDIRQIQKAFSDAGCVYIADGHHRCASAVRVGKERRKANPGYSGEEEFNYFLSVLFPSDELKILDYNRVLADYNGHTKDEVIALISEKAHLVPMEGAEHPMERGAFSMCIEGDWYMGVFHDDIRSDDPVRGLDVAILQEHILEPVFGIKDPTTDSNIAFVGGIRGIEELERRVHEDMKVAFAMYPTSIDSLMDVADAKLLMPPKSTWFEPKLRSGLFIHDISD